MQDERFGPNDCVECVFLVPITDAWMLNRIPIVEDALLESFGGFSMDNSTVKGQWKDSDGNVHADSSRRFTCAVNACQISKLRSIVRDVCREFDQQCIYFSVAGRVEFVAK